MSKVTYQADVPTLMTVCDAKQLNNGILGTLVCNNLVEDSRQVQAGDLFIARPGLESDGRRYIHQAVQKGAIAVLVEAHDIDQFAQATNCTVPLYSVENLASQLGNIANYFYNSPSHELTVIGITGTNGKTTCCQMIARSLAAMGHKVALMGTLGNGFVEDLVDSPNTTLDALSMHRLLAEYRDAGAKYVCMEVSSHALAQGRVNSVNFDVAVFTNLSRDHLDYHGDMDSYAEAKKCLFKYPDLKSVVINSDDRVGNEILNDTEIQVDKYCFCITRINALYEQNSIYTEAVDFNDDGIKAELVTPWGEAVMTTNLIGQFNLSNCLAVITTLGAIGLDLNDSLDALKILPAVTGRMECYGGSEQPMVVIDYAHTPDALMHALKALRPHTKHRLHCVFGCGGDRDRGKRSEMAAIAEEFADNVILTSDNPRGEAIEEIIKEMQTGLLNPRSVSVKADRKEAIDFTINRAVIGDLVLVAGKGHEAYQFIGNEKHKHSDIDWVRKVLAKGNWS
ncbi:MAG: UDP-N-acetylmuramoyl-L-alanyl-D-glutamate--2,6-diaminopimelate ligase [Enterobacterales bacterium]|nr:UDP-N-acetylmuramoyl-L-alanyl-D-glutamate--2,6-diaminopimelate ligase [Enterobacterales bacterium]